MCSADKCTVVVRHSLNKSWLFICAAHDNFTWFWLHLQNAHFQYACRCPDAITITCTKLYSSNETDRAKKQSNQIHLKTNKMQNIYAHRRSSLDQRNFVCWVRCLTLFICFLIFFFFNRGWCERFVYVSCDFGDDNQKWNLVLKSYMVLS